jgi:hypothetical protein
LLVGREDLKGGEIEDNKDGIEIADYKNFFLINYIDRCAISQYSIIYEGFPVYIKKENSSNESYFSINIIR